MSRLFVYGSLKRNKSAHHLLQDAIFIKEATTQPQYHIYHISWFPGMVVDERIKGEGVHGEVYEITQECLKRLDVYECAPELFRCEQLVLEGGEKVIAYFYAQKVSGYELIETGVWND